MENRTNWIIAAAGIDAVRTREAGLTCLHLCTQLSLEGRFVPLAHPASARGDFLGITDSGGVPRGCDLFAAEAISAAQERGCAGIMADFERPLLQELTAALDREAHRAGCRCSSHCRSRNMHQTPAPSRTQRFPAAVSRGVFLSCSDASGAGASPHSWFARVRIFPSPVPIRTARHCRLRNFKSCCTAPVPQFFSPASCAQNISPIPTETMHISSCSTTRIRCAPRRACCAAWAPPACWRYIPTPVAWGF